VALRPDFRADRSFGSIRPDPLVSLLEGSGEKALNNLLSATTFASAAKATISSQRRLGSPRTCS
jgi:hypothetical protein